LAFSFAVPIEELALNPSSERLAAMSLNIDYWLPALFSMSPIFKGNKPRANG
jgi:hypothetical protein